MKIDQEVVNKVAEHAQGLGLQPMDLLVIAAHVVGSNAPEALRTLADALEASAANEETH